MSEKSIRITIPSASDCNASRFGVELITNSLPYDERYLCQTREAALRVADLLIQEKPIPFDYTEWT